MKVRAYIEETVNELVNKVTWPTWDELLNSSMIVLISSAIVALLVWLMDTIFGIADIGFWKGILGFIYDILN